MLQIFIGGGHEPILGNHIMSYIKETVIPTRHAYWGGGIAYVNVRRLCCIQGIDVDDVEFYV
jgi:hypothetical protein